MRRNVLTRWGGALKVLVFPSKQAPNHKSAGILGSPNQRVQQSPRELQVVTDEGPQKKFFAKRNVLTTVAITRTRQHNYILHAPFVPIGAKRIDSFDRRLGVAVSQYPQDLTRLTYSHGSYVAPPVQISVPRYVTFNDVLVQSSHGYPRGALKAPSVKTSGGRCDG